MKDKSDQKVNQAVLGLSDYYRDMFFTVLDNYQRLTQEPDCKDAVKYALKFIEQ
jgi:hypothetical protein